MKYRSVLLLTEPGADATSALAATRVFAPDASSLLVLAATPARRPGRRAPAHAAGQQNQVIAWLEGVRRDASSLAARVDVDLVGELDPDVLEEAVAERAVDLVVAGPRPPAAMPVLAALRRRGGVAVAWIPASARPHQERPFARIVCIGTGSRARGSIAGFLRDHGDPDLHVRVLSLERPSPGELAAALDTSGVRASVELVTRPPDRAANGVVHQGAVDLVVLARFPGPLLLGARWPVPVLVLPRPAARTPTLERPLDAPDVVDLGGLVRIRLGLSSGVGRIPPILDQPVAFVASGQVAAVVTTTAGETVLPLGLGAESLGMFRVRDQPALDPLDAVERVVTVVRPGPLPLVLFDADLSREELGALAAATGVELLAVRLRPFRNCQLLRERLKAAGLAARVVDASAVLDEGPAADVSEALDGVRLARVAIRLRLARFPVAAAVHRGPYPPAVNGLATLRAQEIAGQPWPVPAPPPQPVTLEARLDSATGATPLGGNRIEVELDNKTGRRWLLAAIEGARERLHLQTYLAADDDVGRQVEGALRNAGRRGVAVRVLVDSLRGLHGSLGLRNPLLERISSQPGVELRVARPVAGIPSLEDLKQRDHRKLVVADGQLALVSGRNLAHEYYTGFEEVAVTAKTPWRALPWLDAGARVEGPAVAALERSFLEGWTDAGGKPFEIRSSSPVGPSSIRVVVHHGLRDANTLEAYLALIDGARSQLFALNGFPLLLEIQHALIRAVRRGVRVCLVFGHVAPSHGDEPFEGDWATARAVATWFVHSRMDALVSAGGEGYVFAVRGLPGWAPDLGLVRPYVHGKAMSVDGRLFAVGSANLDVTGSYWEDEVLLVVEDATITRGFDARIGELIAGSVRVDRSDPSWQRLAQRREWLRHWPGVLSP